MNTFGDFDIELHGQTGVEVPTICSKCSHTRKKSKAKCLSVNTEKGCWNCHHCGWVGSLKSGTDTPSRPPKVVIRPNYPTPSSLPLELISWFQSRGISSETLKRHRIGLVTAYLPQCEGDVPCITFPYFRTGEPVNIKYRGLLEKAFRQVAGAEKVLYGLDDLAGDTAILTEGEIDKLSLEEAGLTSVASVPDGAPAPGSHASDQKFAYLTDGALDRFSKIILAVDADPAGVTLREELARRLGRDRCWLVSWPGDCKDANDVLLAHGPDVLAQCLAKATPYPIEGLVEPTAIREKVGALYTNGYPAGVSTDWPSVDQHYTIAPGQLTIMTGIPSHGKSEFLDALMVNLIRRHGWRVAFCSPENAPAEIHAGKLIEKYTGYPLMPGVHQRLPPRLLAEALDWLEESVSFLMPEETWSIADVLHRATSLVRRRGIRGLVIDPWNEFEHSRPAGLSETEYVSSTLGQLRRWARLHDVHVWLVAHPQKLYRKDDGTYPVPTPYDISGSAHWRNKADSCLCIWRDELDEVGTMKLYVQKIRFKHIGRIGEVVLHWDRLTGRYREHDECHEAYT